MVVEDNALNIKLFCDLLTAHGHETRGVTDSREAMDTARDFAPELIITDIQLPYIDGMELMGMIRAEAELARVPIKRAQLHLLDGRRGPLSYALASESPLAAVTHLENAA